MFNTEDEILRRLQEKNLEMAVMFYHWCQRNHLTKRAVGLQSICSICL